jgi:VWFA-related protein
MPRPSLILALTSIAGVAVATVAGQPPTFKSGIDLLRLDVTVVADDGTPVKDLTAFDFAVEVNGQTRPVRSAQFVSFGSAERIAHPIEPEAAPQISTNERSERGRLTAVLIDQESLPVGQDHSTVLALRRYLDGLDAADRTAVISLPHPGVRLDFTSDRAAIRAALDRIHAVPPMGTPLSRMNVAVGEVEAARPTVPAPPRGQSVSSPQNMLLFVLRDLARALIPIDGPKTLVLLAGQMSTGLDIISRAKDFADVAAEARLSIYVVTPYALAMSAAEHSSSLPEPFAGQGGLQVLAGLGGGIVFDVIGRGQGVFDRIQRETSGAYLLGVEADPRADKDRLLKVSVKVTRPGLTVRGPKKTVVPKPRSASPPPRKSIIADALREPTPATALPMRVTSRIARTTEGGKTKVLIFTELEVSDQQAKHLAWGFELRGISGTAANDYEESVAAQSKRVGNTLTMASAALAKPGRYVLKFAAVDGDGRVGSVEHPMEVVAPDATP